jgi:large subunit ribosomal protein L20
MRVKRGVKAKKRRDRVLERAKGFRGRSKNTIRQASSRVDKAMRYMYRDRKKKKGDFRSIWIQRINAAARLLGMNYNGFISGLKAANVEIDRRMLAKLAMEQPEAFKAVADIAAKNVPAGSELKYSLNYQVSGDETGNPALSA